MEECQDFVLHVSCADVQGQDVQILAVADGISGCTKAREGARGLCRNFVEEMRTFLYSNAHPEISQEVCQQATMGFYDDLESPQDYGTTFLVALVCEEATHLFQCGDGDIFFAPSEEPTKFRVFALEAVKHDTYSSATYPADIAIKRGKDRFSTIPTPRRLALMSDGVSPFFVDGHGVVHQDAADRIFSHFETLEFAEGEASEKLSNTLDQEHFKTVHDDRSAVLLYR